MNETMLLDAVLKLAKMYGWRSAHFRPAMTGRGWRTAVQGDGKGYPDVTLVRDRVVFAELKSATGRLAPEQVTWIDRLRAAGAEVWVWRPADLQSIAELLSRPIESTNQLETAQ